MKKEPDLTMREIRLIQVLIFLIAILYIVTR